jgi:hypothetical protein
MADDRRHDRRGLDHECDRAGKMANELAQQPDFLFDECVRPVLDET